MNKCRDILTVLVFLVYLPGCYPITIRKISCPVVEIPSLTQTAERSSDQKNTISSLVSYVGDELISQGFVKNKGEHLDFYEENDILLSALIIDDQLEDEQARKLQVVLFYQEKKPNVIFIQFQQEGLLKGKKLADMDGHCKNMIERLCEKLKIKVAKEQHINTGIIIYELSK